MQIGNMQEFRESQLSKVERRKEEEKQIRKGVYQTKMLLESQEMEIFNKEYDKSRERTEETRTERKDTETKRQDRKKTDVHTEMEKMLSAVGKSIALKI